MFNLWGESLMLQPPEQMHFAYTFLIILNYLPKVY